jgi:cell fate regulator YaaT (PSP1 superfamily)
VQEDIQTSTGSETDDDAVPFTGGAADAAPPPPATTVDVRFRVSGQARAFDAGSIEGLRPGEPVIVDTDRGQELGHVASLPRPRWAEEEAQRLPRVVRRADARDLARAEHNRGQEKTARRIFLDRVERLGLPVKLIRVDYRFDGGKAAFWFLAGERADFRGLARDLSQALHTRIEMRQIGERDETRLVGGVGPCGRELCCNSWMRDFEAVSVKMAKEQGLSLNPSKLAGMCGRLKCCLRYEYDTYVSLRRGLPRVGARVTSVKGDGTVVKHLTLKQRILLQREEDGVTVECSLEDLVERRVEPAGAGAGVEAATAPTAAAEVATDGPEAAERNGVDRPRGAEARPRERRPATARDRGAPPRERGAGPPREGAAPRRSRPPGPAGAPGGGPPAPAISAEGGEKPRDGASRGRSSRGGRGRRSRPRGPRPEGSGPSGNS